MPICIVLGAQWGDEGKGKIVDAIAQQADMVVRYQGGSNAGHTLVVDRQIYKLHLLPSGILNPACQCLLGAGMVIDLEQLVTEIATLEKIVSLEQRLIISEQAHIILPSHRVLDKLWEHQRGKGALGTTHRGIGPCYSDKIRRIGIRIADLAYPQRLATQIHLHWQAHPQLHGCNELSEAMLLTHCQTYAAPALACKGHVSARIAEANAQHRRIVLEGAQGTLLDIDHGTYPYVTSSNPIAGGACAGAGVGPTAISQVVGMAKAYCTRVGEGPMPTEQHGDLGKRLQQQGDEFGTTTQRPRRCGWLDLVALAYAVKLNGFTALAFSKLDVLDGFEQVKVCTDYQYHTYITRQFNSDIDFLNKVQPIYHTMPGWQNSHNTSHYNDLPQACQNFVQYIENYLQVPIVLLSTGAERGALIWRKPLF